MTRASLGRSIAWSATGRIWSAIRPAPRTAAARPVRSILPAVIVVAIYVSFACTGLWVLAGWATDDASRVVVTNLLALAFDIGAAALLFHAARRAGTKRASVAWATLAIATVVYAVGDGLFAWFELALGVVSFPSPADLAYVAYYPIIVAALLSLPSHRMSRPERLRMAIDSAIIVVGGGMIIWELILRSALQSAGTEPAALLLTIGYPIGDLVLLFGLATIALRRPRGADPLALSAVAAGLLLVLVADIWYAQGDVESGGVWQNAPDLAYMASAAAFATAGFLQARVRPKSRRGREGDRMPRPLAYLPYLALAAGYGTLLAATRADSATLVELIMGSIVLTALVLVRQELVLRENTVLETRHARRESEARFRSLAANATDAIALVDPGGIVTDATDAVRRVLGLDARTLIGRPISSLAHAEDAPRLAAMIRDTAEQRASTKPLEWRLWDGNGIWRQVETVATNLLDNPTVRSVVLTTRDVRERKVLEQRLQQLALHDVLTGLANRTLFLDRLDHAFTTAGRRGAGTVVLAINIDGFKRVNDCLGHPAGDVLLQEVATRLTRSLRAADSCARLGGDEFAVLLEGTSSLDDGRAAAHRIQSALREPVSLAQGIVHVTVRVGITVAAASADGPAAVVRDAVIAMAHARQEGRDGIAVFEPAMHKALEGRFELENDLRQALTRDELMLQYQPIVDLETGELVAAEALVRWDHPVRGRLAPNLFIPLAEETGLIGQVGAWVVRAACHEVAHWARIAHSRVPRVGVNLSAHDVADPNLPWALQEALGQAGAVPAWLSLEVTEGLLMENTGATLERLHAIRALGISIAIDDFGTGYSSLAYLQQFPMSHIKIDRSFVAPLDDPAREPGVVRAVVEIGRSMGMSTIAEGIETPTQLHRLRTLGCSLGQGYLLGRPLDSEAIRDLVRNPVRSDWAGDHSAPRPARGRRRRMASS
jgi:diguanylate cyclase (GGDEF)-like protein/PAS domain S-box-containing protein